MIGWSNDFCLPHYVQHFRTPTAAPIIRTGISSRIFPLSLRDKVWIKGITDKRSISSKPNKLAKNENRPRSRTGSQTAAVRFSLAVF